MSSILGSTIILCSKKEEKHCQLNYEAVFFFNDIDYKSYSDCRNGKMCVVGRIMAPKHVCILIHM